jgi:hypothetical protein
MGASFFKTSHRGKSLSDAYKDAKDCAEEEYGHDPYNGTISTTHGVQDVTAYYKASNKPLSEYIDTWVENGLKRDCYAICLEEPKTNTNKIKTQVEHVVTPGTKKWVLKYVVYAGWDDKMIGSFATKGDAVKKAREHTEKTQINTKVCMEKVLEKGTTTVAKISYKKSTSEKEGKWAFFGWAAE